MFAKKRQIGCLLIVLASHTSSAVAQSSRGDDGWPTKYYHPVSPLPPDLGFTYDHASTALEGALRGRAALLHAQGNYWLSVQQASICREQSRAMALENEQRWIEYRIARRVWIEWDRKRRSAQQRRVNDALRPNKYAVYRLEADQLDRITGAIAWPDVLRADEYEDLRQKLEKLFRARIGYRETTVANSVETVRCTNTLGEKLWLNRASIDQRDYLAAQKFLCGLKYDADTQPVAMGSEDPHSVSLTPHTLASLTQSN